MERKGNREITRAAWELVSSRRGRIILAFSLVPIIPLIAACSGQATNIGRLILPNAGGLILPNTPTPVRTPVALKPRLDVNSWCEDDGEGGSQPVVEVGSNLGELRGANGEAALLLVFKKTGDSRVLGILNEFGENGPWQYRKTFTPRGKYSNVGPEYKVDEGESLTFGAYWARIISYQNMRIPEFWGQITAVAGTVATCSNTNSR